MDPDEDAQLDRNVEGTPPAETGAGPPAEHETHATTAGAVAAGAVTGGVIGLAGGPIGAAIGAVGGAIVAAAAERMMHSDEDDPVDEPADVAGETSRASKEDELASP